MPELPEVETVRRQLEPVLVGREITGSRVSWARTLGGATRRQFASAVEGSRVTAVRRRGKYLIFDLARDAGPAGVLVGHLRMSGRMHVVSPDAPAARWCRVELHLADGNTFQFVDVRKFGRLVHADHETDVLPALGPEPLGPDFTATWFAKALKGRRRRLKSLLLDQAFVAGLGNIYVDESLFEARLHPLRRADRVPQARAVALYEAIRETLDAAIAREGSSFDAFYRTPEGQPGSYQAQFKVYGRAGRPCRRCGRTLRRLVVDQRGTHVCTRCQPAPRVRRAR